MTKKYPTANVMANINGTVTKTQNGQHGPATTIGVPSGYVSRANI